MSTWPRLGFAGVQPVTVIVKIGLSSVFDANAWNSVGYGLSKRTGAVSPWTPPSPPGQDSRLVCTVQIHR